MSQDNNNICGTICQKKKPNRISLAFKIIYEMEVIFIYQKECWELFSIPTITNTEYPDDECIKLQFYCEKTNTNINVYYPKNENIDPDALSKIMKTILSVCLRCTGKKPLHDNGYIVH